MNANLPTEVEFQIDQDACLKGFLRTPPEPRGMIVFVHGSGSSRFSTRNHQVARALTQAGFATLLMDLLTACEEQTDAITRELRFDIPLLARRVIATIDWLGSQAPLAELPVGLFGASTGAAAALVGASEQPERVAAIVCRGGRPDLAGESLKLVRAPTLMIVGSLDTTVLELNRYASYRMFAPLRLVIIDGATHLFEEPRALEQVSQHALGWFTKYLIRLPPDRSSAFRPAEART
ncbi:dienelactone hydrolase family protein [Peristeroidobacter soli]|jgi:pimeloyl-ACP methyl ester carboxylesterase|uniref:dienelactone hydrolase family protein n=1 Tax=Peristeroidobacter soli TaxID=2497877 RepID=UPI00101C301B|nr:alpha/beta family hydrolase [Peristeroidobacter soli]